MKALATERERYVEYGGNPDKRPTTTIETVKLDHVQLVSRYNQHDELLTMFEVVSALDPKLRAAMQSVFCDSKNTATYSVELFEGVSREAAQKIADAMSALLVTAYGGHNGVHVAGSVGYAEGRWPAHE